MVFLNGMAITEPGRRGERIFDDSFLLCVHAAPEPLDFIPPVGPWGSEWQVEVDTRAWRVDPRVVLAGEKLALESRSLMLLRRVAGVAL
jgi:glycogen operon protein